MSIDLPAFFARLKSHPIGVSILREQAEEILARRKEAAARLRAADATLRKNLPGLLDVEAAAMQKYSAAAKALASAYADLARAKAATRSARATSEAEVRTAEAELRKTPPAAIAQFIAQLDEAIAEVRRNGGVTDRKLAPDERRVRRDWVDPTSHWKFIPTGAAERWMERALRVHREASALWRETPDETELAARLAELLAELNRPDEATEGAA